MFNPEQLLKQMVGGALGGAFGGKRKTGRGIGGGGLGAALGGNKAALGLGLLGVAIAAYDHYAKSNPSAPAAATTPPPTPVPPAARLTPSPAPPPPPPPSAANAPTRAQPMLDLHKQEAALMVRAMIAAASADGSIDAEERARIVERARQAGDDADTLAYLEAEMARPATRDELVAQTPRSLAEAVFAASVLGMTPDTDIERDYLGGLASQLGISPARSAEIVSSLGHD